MRHQGLRSGRACRRRYCCAALLRDAKSPCGGGRKLGTRHSLVAVSSASSRYGPLAMPGTVRRDGPCRLATSRPLGATAFSSVCPHQQASGCLLVSFIDMTNSARAVQARRRPPPQVLGSAWPRALWLVQAGTSQAPISLWRHASHDIYRLTTADAITACRVLARPRRRR